MQGATIIDATGNPPIENGVIVLRGNQIIQVGQFGRVDLPEDAEIINLEGKWIIPGFIDLHVHFWESGKTWAQPTFVIDLREFVPYEEEVAFMKRRISYTLEKYLCAGVTSVVPLGAIGWEYEVRELAKRQEKAPNVYLAGGFISNYPPENGFPVFDGEQTGFWIENADDAQGLIHYLDSTNVDLIKAGFIGGKGYAMETFEPKLREIIKESHARNLKVSVHAVELENAKVALRAGADILAHTVNDSIIDEEFIKLARQNSAVITSSLGVISSFNEVLTSTYTLSDMDDCCGDPEVIQSWVEWAEIPENEKPPIPNGILATDQSREIMLENTRIAYQAGLPICVGSDGGNIGSLHGPSFHRELKLLAKAGLSAMDILIAATKNGALALGMESKLGTIEIGKQADLLVLKSNPLESENNLKHIELVIVQGNLIKREELINH
jgi:imidazolonepropionase-like amidohydrolase